MFQPFLHHGDSLPSETEIEDQLQLDSEEVIKTGTQKCNESETSGDEYNVTSEGDSGRDSEF